VKGLRPEEFRAIYARHYDAVLRYAWRRVGADDAPDVTAEVFTVVWRRAEAIPARNVLPWLYGVARKVVANHLRGAGRVERLADHPGDPSVAARDVADQVAARHLVHRAWLSLGEGDRELLALIGWEGLRVREAARVLGCSTATCSVRLHRARARLRQAMSREDAAETATPPHQPTAVRTEDTRCA
jgi:RNA polymerase sigma-70 factor (ECF subfamily)